MVAFERAVDAVEWSLLLQEVMMEVGEGRGLDGCWGHGGREVHDFLGGLDRGRWARVPLAGRIEKFRRWF